MRTGRYRIRRGIWDTSVLQAEYDVPSLLAGHVDASIRRLVWKDVPYYETSHVMYVEAPQSKPDAYPLPAQTQDNSNAK